MQAVVMAGGEGSRLRPLTINRPKPMVQIVNKPCLGHIFDLLLRHGIDEAFVTLQYLASVIQDSYGDGGGLGLRLRYSIEETPLGTGGSVRQIADQLAGTFIVISGDAMTDIDLSKVVAFHKERGAAVTLTLVHVPNPLEYGVVITNEDGRIAKFLEKPSWGEVFSDTINTGIYVMEPRVLKRYAVGEVFDFSKDLFPKLLAEGEPLFGYVADGYWTDIGSIAEYARANADLLQGKVRTAPLGRELMPGVVVNGDVEIDPTARITGPVFLGEGAKIGAHVEIVGPTVLRDYVSVDVGAVVDRSIVWRNTYIGERAELHGAIVGRQCALKARVVLEEGSVVGDHSVVNEHARVRAQVKIWPDKQVESGAVVGSSLIWGAQGRRALFGRFGVTGLVNIDLTPEFVARLGAAYASTLPLGATITMNRDQHRSSRMLKRGLMSGIVSAGVDVADLSQAPLPIGRFHTRRIGAAGGVHVRISPFDVRVCDVKFFDRQALDMDKAQERKVENVFFREDLRRVSHEDVGRVVNDMHFLAAFTALSVRSSPGVVAVPVYAPSSIESVVATSGGRVQRVRASAEAQMSLAAREHPLLVGDGVGGFIFPRFHPSFDGLFATVRRLELLAATRQKLSDVVDATPPIHVARLQVSCPWEQKGRVMRMLAQDPQTGKTRQVDGVKHQNDGEWVLVLPDADRPLFNVYAEAPDDDRAWTLVHEYAERLERLRVGD